MREEQEVVKEEQAAWMEEHATLKHKVTDQKRKLKKKGQDIIHLTIDRDTLQRRKTSSGRRLRRGARGLAGAGTCHGKKSDTGYQTHTTAAACPFTWQ